MKKKYDRMDKLKKNYWGKGWCEIKKLDKISVYFCLLRGFFFLCYMFCLLGKRFEKLL